MIYVIVTPVDPRSLVEGRASPPGWTGETPVTPSSRSNVTSAHDSAVLICRLYITEVTFTVWPNGH